jgi:hypothetical protein
MISTLKWAKICPSWRRALQLYFGHPLNFFYDSKCLIYREELHMMQE